MAIQTQTFEGMSGGMNMAIPANQIDDTEARYIQDCLLHLPGITIRRGPLVPIIGLPVFPTPVTGLVQTLDPNGANRLAVLRGDTVNGYLSVLSPSLTTYVDLPWNGAMPSSPPSNPYRIVDSKPSITGGAWIGTTSQYNSNGPVQSLALWRGATNADYSTGTVTATRGSTTVTGSGTSWLANVSAGSFLFANTDDGGTLAYIGVVKSVDSNTQITLGVGSLYALTAKVYNITSIRGFAPRVVAGRITCATGSTTVTGANTKFLSQGVNSGVWNLYRASDYTWIGKVSVVNNDTSITLAANAAIALNNERYVAIRQNADMNISTMSVADRKVGFLNAIYSERQWYANLGQRFELTSRVWFSDPSDPEAVDMSAFDGSFIDIGSSRGVNSPIKAIVPAYNALVVFKENETFGVFGASPTQFEVRKIEDDGTLGGMSVQQYGGGVIWAGRDGIHFFDGIQADNISNPKLGDYYKNMIRSFNPTTYRMWSMMMRDHYFLFIENAQPNQAVIKGNTSTTPAKMTIVVNMNTRAFTVFTNVDIRGSVVMPADTGEETWFIVNGYDGTVTRTFGDFPQTIGTDAVGVADTSGQKALGKFTLTEPGILRKITAYIKVFTAGTGVATFRGIIYDGAGNFVAQSDNTVDVDGASTANSVWADFTFSNLSPVAGDYWLGVIDVLSGGTAVIAAVARAGGSNTFFTNGDVYADGPSSTLGVNGTGNPNRTLSVYATYTPTTSAAFICDAAALFDNSGNDTITCQGSSAPGPDFYVESKKYNAGDSMRLKLFKMLAIHYLAQGDGLRVDTVVGLNNIGRQANTILPATVFVWDNMQAQFGTWDNLGVTGGTWDNLISSVFRPKRIKFLKRTQNFAFRLYQNSANVNNVRVGPFDLAFKYQRPMRV